MSRMNWIDNVIQRYNTEQIWTEESHKPADQRAHFVPNKVNENGYKPRHNKGLEFWETREKRNAIKGGKYQIGLRLTILDTGKKQHLKFLSGIL